VAQAPCFGVFSGYCGAQDTFYVGNMKGVGRIYQQTFVDTYSKVAFAKLYDRKTPLTAADLLNDRVIPFFDEQSVKLQRVLTDPGTEYCGNPEHHDYELYFAVEDIDHSRTKTKSPQTNGIFETLDLSRRQIGKIAEVEEHGMFFEQRFDIEGRIAFAPIQQARMQERAHSGILETSQ
jgi:hypothetical protein